MLEIPVSPCYPLRRFHQVALRLQLLPYCIHKRLGLATNYNMMLPFITKAAIATQSLAPVKIAATLNHVRGGDMGAAAVQAFDMGLAKTRLEGLAYGTVTALM